LYRAFDEAESRGLSINGKIPNEKAFTDGIALFLRSYGYCAINGRLGGHTSDDEVWLRKDDGESHHYDIVAGPAGAHSRWDKLAAICTPALF
jgi:hypothetical protein